MNRKASRFVFGLSVLFALVALTPNTRGQCSCNIANDPCPSQCFICKSVPVSCDCETGCAMTCGCPSGWFQVGCGLSNCAFHFVQTQCQHVQMKFISECDLCAPGRYGPTCLACPGGAATPCNNNGVCNQGIFGDGACVCNPGYAGAACQYSDAVTCNGHGTAQSDGTCVCNPPWTAPFCANCSSSDADGDLHTACVDCDDGNPSIWSAPSEVLDLNGSQASVTTLTWQASADLGGTTVTYRVLRSTIPSDFVSLPFCLTAADPTARVATDAETPGPSGAFFYLVRGISGCTAGAGTLGSSSAGVPRQGSCP